MPEKVNQQEARKFFADVQPFVTADRPQLVFDLSQVTQLDAAGIEMLLRCVEEVMKRDGDLKLASLSRQARMVLELTRTDRLFEIYLNSTEAARSFSGFLPNAMQSIPGNPTRAADPTQLAA
jgi:anti-sigma B factor antagonist